MGSIPGPIITFRVDSPQVSAAATGAFNQVKAQAKQTTAAIADDWRRMSAQIRASMAQDVMSTREQLSARRAIVDVLGREIALYRSKNELSAKELSNLKAMTLELERQKSHLAGKGGLTAGTAAFNTQAYLGVTRALDSIVNRYFGGAAGSLFRTVRDFGYYGSIGAGGATGEGGGGFFSKLTSPVGLGVLGGTGALAGIGAAMAAMAVHGGKLAIELTDMAHKTGLSTEAAIRLNSAAGVLGVSMDSLGVGFKKFDTLIVEANAGNKKAAALFNVLGINIKKAAEDPFSAIQQLAKALSGVPDGALKVLVATELFGRGGQQLLPVLSELDKVMSLTKSSSEDLSRALGKDSVDSAIALKAAMVNWRNETDALEVSLTRLLPTITKIVDVAARVAQGNPVPNSLDVYLKTQGLQLSAYGHSQFQYLQGVSGPNELQNPLYAISELKKFVSVGSASNVGKLFEPLKQAASQTAKNLDRLQQAAVNLKGGFERARDAQAAFWKSVSEDLYRTGAASGHPFYPTTADQVLSRVFNPRRNVAPYLGPRVGVSGGNVLGGLGLRPISTNVSASQTDILQVILGGDYNKIFDTRDQEYKQELAQLKQALDAKLISYQQYNTAVEAINEDLHKEMMRQNEEFNHQADQLFEQLINGDRNFGRTLVKDLRDAMLAPIRNMFDQVVGSLLGGFSRGVQGGFNGTIGTGLSRFATVPFLGNLIPGLSGKGNAPTGTAQDPIYVTMPGLGPGGATGLGAGIGALPLIGPGGSLIPGGGGSSGGGILGAFHRFLGGGGGGSFGNGPGLLPTIGGGLLMGLGAKTGGALGGLEGAAGGAMSGALTGLMFGGPVGAAIGGIIGGIGGLISGIIGPSFQDRVRKSMTNQQYYLPPSETFSFASNGSIANTLSTGYSSAGGRFSTFNLPNNTPFYASAIRGPLSYSQYLALQNEQNATNTNQPFLGFPGTNPFIGQGPAGSKAGPVNFNITAMDAKGVSDFFTQHSDTISAIITSRSIGSSSSRWGVSVRRAASLP